MIHAHPAVASELPRGTNTVAACLSRLVCIVALLMVLWIPHRAGKSLAPSHFLAAGVVGLVIAAVLLCVPTSECTRTIKSVRSHTAATEVAQHIGMTRAASGQGTGLKQWMTRAAGPTFILAGALTAIALTGGWQSGLSLLLLLPALALDTVMGNRGVLVILCAVSLGMFVMCLVARASGSIQEQFMADIVVPIEWAAASALVYWLRMLLAERRWAALTALRTAKSPSRETGVMQHPRGDLLAQIAHELLTPLAAIRAGAGLLSTPIVVYEPLGDLPAGSSGVLDMEASRKVAQNVQRNALRLTLLMEDLLESARMEASSVPMHLARHACSIALRKATGAVALLCEGQRQHVVWSVIPAGLTYWGDARRVDQVLVNLLANAHKYAGADATITLTARAWAGGVRWEVGDDGPSLGETTLMHLFEHNSRAPRFRGSGHGLGLSIAKSLVELHGGQIWAENNADCGCRFIFWLPFPDRERTTVEASDVAVEGEQE